jgi:hypothetical protein
VVSKPGNARSRKKERCSSRYAWSHLRTYACGNASMPTRGKDSVREIREYFIPDFSNWKNYDSYQEAFQRLLRDLKPDTILL